MNNKIIALVDGSVYSQSVCESAAWIALRTGAAVDLVHVLGRRETATAADLSGTIALGARSALLQELSSLDEQRARLALKRGHAILEDAEAVVKQAGVSNVTARLRNGDLLETVSEFETSADMLVVGKRGEAADFAKLHLGSNLERIARAAHKPVFVAARAMRQIHRVLIAYDGGSSATKAVEYVARSPLFAGLAIKLLMAGVESEQRNKQLQDASAMLEARGYEVSTGIIAGHPEKMISETVDRNGIDLLVMGAYGHSRIRSLIIGSTTAEMLRSCKIPVLLFR